MHMLSFINFLFVSTGRTGGVVHSLATHPKLNEIIFARRRDVYVYSTEIEEDIMEIT